MKNDRWVKRWSVPGSNGKTWIVAIDKNGVYGCSCPVWKFKRQECHHIKMVKANGGEELKIKSKPNLVRATVNKPVFKEDKNELWIPLVAIPDALMMEATICFYLMKYGYSMGEIRAIRRIPGQWTGKGIIAHIEEHGEAEYPEGWYKSGF